MQISNKKLAFYVALIAAALVIGLLFTEHITTTQAQLALVAIAGACAPFGIADVFYDYLGIIFRVAETVVSLTPSTEDDKVLAELKAVVSVTPAPDSNVVTDVSLAG